MSVLNTLTLLGQKVADSPAAQQKLLELAHMVLSSKSAEQVEDRITAAALAVAYKAGAREASNAALKASAAVKRIAAPLKKAGPK